MDDIIPGQPFSLPANLDLTAAMPLRSELLRRRGSPLDLDGSDVQRLGGLCLQVLISAKAAWALDGADFRVSAPSQALREVLSTLGAETLCDRQQEIGH